MRSTPISLRRSWVRHRSARLTDLGRHGLRARGRDGEVPGEAGTACCPRSSECPCDPRGHPQHPRTARPSLIAQCCHRRPGLRTGQSLRAFPSKRRAMRKSVGKTKASARPRAEQTGFDSSRFPRVRRTPAFRPPNPGRPLTTTDSGRPFTHTPDMSLFLSANNANRRRGRRPPPTSMTSPGSCLPPHQRHSWTIYPQ